MTSTRPTPDLDPAQDARIRALLAELGSGPDGEPLPPEVAARLDDTLALLVAERGRAGGARPEDETTADNVVPLRRRWLPRAAVAAAAVIVLGAGGVFVANLGQMSGTGLSSSSDSADKSTAEGQDSGGGSSSDSESGTDSGTGATAAPRPERCLVRERRDGPAPGTRLDALPRRPGCGGGRCC